MQAVNINKQKFAPPCKIFAPSVWGQSYNRLGETFVSIIHRDLVICVVLALHFFETSESQNTYRN